MKNISIIIPLYKGQKHINRLLKMMEDNVHHLSQTENAIEVILVNDYPQENVTIEDSSRYSFNIRLIVNVQNEGIHKSRVIGLGYAQGDYILFLDQDDMITADYLSTQIETIQGADIVICNGIYGKRKSKIYNSRSAQEKVLRKNFFFNREYPLVSPGQVLIKKAVIPEEWKINILKTNGADDFYLWCILADRECKYAINPKIQYFHIEHGDNTSSNSVQMNASVLEMINILEDNQLISRDSLETLKTTEMHRKTGYREIKEKIEANKDFIFANVLKQMKMRKTFAIYGYGSIGRDLCLYLEHKGLVPDYIIDKNSNNITDCKWPMYSLEDALQQVDMIIITLAGRCLNIKDKLIEKKVTDNILILKEYI